MAGSCFVRNASKYELVGVGSSVILLASVASCEPEAAGLLEELV